MHAVELRSIVAPEVTGLSARTVGACGPEQIVRMPLPCHSLHLIERDSSVWLKSMSLLFPLNSFCLRSLALALALACGAGIAFAQGLQATATQDPTKPEVQPPLDVDRDPVPSIDPVVVEPPRPENATNANPQQAQKGQNGMYILHADVDEVLLDCAVIDEKGRTVNDLAEKDFRVWEDGVPQTINAFQHQDAPVSMGILVDNSGSMRDKRGAVNGAAFNILRDSNPQDSTFVVNFNDHAYLDQGFTSNLAALNRGLSRFDSRGTTALYDAVAASATELAKHATHRKKVLLIITDGADNASRLTLQQAIRRVQNLGGPVVYCIGLLYDTNREEYRQARSALELLAQETGGVAYFPGSLGEVNEIATQVASDIRDQYTIAYHSTKPSNQGGYRFVHVEAQARNHGKLRVRTRRGYYATPDKSNETAQGAEQP